MADWSGFTDDELRRLKQGNIEKRDVKESKVGQQQRRKVKEKKVNLRITKQTQEQDSITVADKEGDNDVNVNHPSPSADSTKLKVKRLEITEKEDAKHKAADKAANDEKAQQDHGVVTENKVKAEDQCAIKELSGDQIVELEKDNLEKLQQQQKHIKDQNKKKQALIKEALQQKFRQTQSEAVKLKEIQKELSHLDEILQADVEVLRTKIDESCVLFSQAQRRYEKAEAEYVDAKLHYFQQKEQKEQLTEHLYAIIQENEVRKAKKLEELMLKLSYSELSSPTAPIAPSPDGQLITDNEENNLVKPDPSE